MSTVENDLKKLQAELAELRGDLAKIAGTLGAAIRHGAADAVSGLTEGCDLQDDVRRKMRDVARKIEEKPVSAILTTFAVGVILGMIVNARGR